ncbi:MAG TPA: hypothetical protein VIR32_02690 [Lachnospiraceae bacterium]
MKKFTKISLIIATLLVVVGGITLTSGIVMGGGFHSMKRTVLDYAAQYDSDIGWNVDMDWFDDQQKRATHVESYPAKDIKSIDIEVSAGQASIIKDFVEEVEVYYGRKDKVEVGLEKGILKIKEKVKVKTIIGKNRGSDITIIVPQDMDLEKLSGEVGAGELDIDSVSAKSYDLQVNVGQIEATLPGREKDYNASLEVNVGEISFGENDYSGLASSKKLVSTDAKRDLVVQCDVGNCEIDFEK